MIEDEKRKMYNHERAMREQAYHEEVDRIRKEKEKETERLRAAQEKASDKQSALDELRAQRIQVGVFNHNSDEIVVHNITKCLFNSGL
jgi:phosphoglycolate phosphatase-like HAD superfamily hydrolase